MNDEANDTTPPPPTDPVDDAEARRFFNLFERFVRSQERQAYALETIAVAVKSADETLTHVVEVQYHGIK